MREFNTREAKGDYSITFDTDDRKAFEQVQTLCRVLIDGKDGDAIPIVWMNEWYWNNSDVCCDKHVSDLFGKMLKDWKKENEAE